MKDRKTFDINPFAESRKRLNNSIFNRNLTRKVDDKFKHKTFAKRFSWSNTAFEGMGFVAQVASMVTAFTMLSYVFPNVNIIARVCFSIVVVLAMEVIKRNSWDDVMQGIFQYKSVEAFAAVLALGVTAISIYISVEGAKILPNIIIADATMEAPTLKSLDDLKADHGQKIEAKKAEIVSKDKEIKEYVRNNHSSTDPNKLSSARGVKKGYDELKKQRATIEKQLHELEGKAEVRLVDAEEYNDLAHQKVEVDYEAAVLEVKNQRELLSEELVIAAIGFELLFIISMCFSWWYFTNVKKEKEEIEKAKRKNSSATSNKPNESKANNDLAEEDEDAEAHQAPVAKQKRMSYIDYEEVEDDDSNSNDTEYVEYTRICPQCNTGFVHNSHNHIYCKRSCATAAREERNRA